MVLQGYLEYRNGQLLGQVKGNNFKSYSSCRMPQLFFNLKCQVINTIHSPLVQDLNKQSNRLLDILVLQARSSYGTCEQQCIWIVVFSFWSSHLLSVFSVQCVVRSIYHSHSFLQPGRVFRQHIASSLATLIQALQARADKRPQRLIIMILREKTRRVVQSCSFDLSFTLPLGFIAEESSKMKCIITKLSHPAG